MVCVPGTEGETDSQKAFPRPPDQNQPLNPHYCLGLFHSSEQSLLPGIAIVSLSRLHVGTLSVLFIVTFSA